MFEMSSYHDFYKRLRTPVESALKNEDDELLLLNYRDLSIKIQTWAILSNRELPRDFDVEEYIPKYAKDGKKLRLVLLSNESINNLSFDLDPELKDRVSFAATSWCLLILLCSSVVNT